MFYRIHFLGTLAGFGFLVGVLTGSLGAIAAEPHTPSHGHSPSPTAPFRRIDQPLSNRIAVTVVGLGLLGTELWWFLGRKSKPRRATTSGGLQEITITVDGGYEPNRVVVQAGQPVRLKFHRKDPSGCLEAVRLPDFHLATDLPLNQVTPLDFTPNQPGTYLFTCGMNMFRGTVEVVAPDTTPNEALEAVA